MIIAKSYHAITPHLRFLLGKYKNSKSCLYVKKLDDIDLGILKELIAESIKLLSKRYS